MRTRRLWLPPGIEPSPEPGWVIVRARIIRREYRTTGWRSKRTGRLVSFAAARRWPGKMVAVRRLVRVRWEVTEKRERKRPPPPPREAEEWEVTVSYRGKGKPVDITVRMIARTPGATYTKDQVRKAFWFAHKQSPSALKEWDMAVMDWQSGRIGYQYPSRKVTLDEAFENAGGIFTTVGMAGLRVARVEL